jgi:hypothetical protein
VGSIDDLQRMLTAEQVGQRLALRILRRLDVEMLEVVPEESRAAD